MVVPRVALVCLLLGACTTVEQYSTQVYIPPESVRDPAQLSSDIKTCVTWSKAVPEGSALGDITQASGEGVSSNLADAPLSIWVPILGGVGGGVSQSLRSLGLTSTDQIHAFVWCLYEDSGEHHKYRVLDPMLWR